MNDSPTAAPVTPPEAPRFGFERRKGKIMKDLVIRLDEMAAGWLCNGLPDAELPHEAARAIERLRDDEKRLNWLADKNNAIGNVQLPTWCVLNNPDSLRAAIDAAMRSAA